MASELAPVARASSTYRRWVIAMSLGELVAFSVPTAAWGVTAAAGLGDTVAYVPVVLAGAGEGAVLGYAQSRVLRRVLPAFDPTAWVRVTAAGGALGWAVALTPSAFHGALSGLPLGVLVVLGAVGAAALLCSIGGAQATVLRRHVERTGEWITANALAWLAVLPVIFAVAPERPAGARAAVAIGGGLGSGFTVAAVTGVVLLRLLRSPRAQPPQPLRRRAAIHLNHAHAWLYERTGGRAGGRIRGHPVLLLTTTGRHSGLARRTPVQYERLDGDPILVATANGAPEPPAWWRNLDADPDVIVQIADQAWHARAVTVEGEERRRLWPRMCAWNGHLDALQCKAGRELPLVRLVRLVSR